MTFKELKEKLEQFPENCMVMIQDNNWTPDKSWTPHVHATSVTIGINQEDGCAFISDYVEDDDYG